MGDECKYSFWDLFEAANRRIATQDEIKEFNKLDQEKRNERVILWAKLANWGIVERVGSDGLIYIAFCKEWGTV